MALVSGLVSSKNSGLLSGLNPQGVAAASATELLGLVFSMATAPASLTSANATDQWLMQGAGPVANATGSETLANNTGTLETAAVGYWNGTDFISLDSWLTDSVAINLDSLVASGSTAGNSNNEDLSICLVFKLTSNIVSGNYLMSKQASGATAGWLLSYNTGQLQFTITDGTNSASVSKTVAAADVGDSAIHWIKCWYDNSADMLYMRSDLWDFEEDASSSNVTGSLTNAASFQVNGRHGAPSLEGQADLTVYYSGASVGASAEAYYDEIIPMIGYDPTGLLSTVSLPADLASAPISAVDNVIYQKNTLPIVYNANLSPTFGLWCNEAASTDFRTVGDHLNESAGEVTSVFTVNTLPGVGELHYVFDTGAADGVNYYDRRALYLDETGLLSFLVTDVNGDTVAIIDLGTVSINTEYTAVTQWSELADLDTGSVRVKLNALDGKSSGLAFTSGGLHSNQLCIGSSESTASAQLDGVIQSITSYDEARAMAGTVAYATYTLPAYGLRNIRIAADPMQALIDAMGHNVKPDYMWMGDQEGNGAIEIGGSGIDLINSGTAKTVQNDTDALLPGTKVCTMNSNTNQMTSTNSAVQAGTGSFAVIYIHTYDTTVNNASIIGTYDGVLGWTVYQTTSGIQGFIRSSGVYYATIAIAHGTANAQCHLIRRTTSTNDWDIFTREGSANGTETTVVDATSGTDFSIGSTNGSAARGSWGLCAYWAGAPGEAITDAMRAALQTALNLD